MASVVTSFKESVSKPEFSLHKFLKKNKGAILQLEKKVDEKQKKAMLRSENIESFMPLIESAIPEKRKVHFFVNYGGVEYLDNFIATTVKKWELQGKTRAEKKKITPSFPAFFVVIANGEMHWTTHIFIGLGRRQIPLWWGMNSLSGLWSQVTKYFEKMMDETAKNNEIRLEKFEHQDDSHSCGYFSILYALLFAIFWRSNETQKSAQALFKFVDKHVKELKNDDLLDVFNSLVRVVAHENPSPMAQFISSQLGHDNPT